MGDIMVEAYCVKCNAKKNIKKPENITTKNGKPAIVGVCPTCGTKLYRMGPALT